MNEHIISILSKVASHGRCLNEFNPEFPIYIDMDPRDFGEGSVITIGQVKILIDGVDGYSKRDIADTLISSNVFNVELDDDYQSVWWSFSSSIEMDFNKLQSIIPEAGKGCGLATEAMQHGIRWNTLFLATIPNHDILSEEWKALYDVASPSLLCNGNEVFSYISTLYDMASL